MRVKRLFLLVCLLILLCGMGTTAYASGTTGETEKKGLVISEVVSSNSCSLVDPVLGKPDWIELYNDSPDPINLKGCSIGKSKKSRYFFEDIVIGPGEYMVLYCCDAPDDAVADKVCTGFKLSKDGTIIMLSSPDSIIQVLRVPKLNKDVSYGIGSEGKYEFFNITTPGAANTGSPIGDPGRLETSSPLSSTGVISGVSSLAEQAFDRLEAGILNYGLSGGTASVMEAAMQTKTSVQAENSNTKKERCERPSFSAKGGHQAGSSVKLIITTATKGAKIYYTLDGSSPTESSAKYSGPLKIRKPSKTAGVTVIAVAIKSGMLQSAEAATTYLFDDPHSLPVICLSIKKSDLDYVSGSKERGDRRERAGYVEYYNEDGELGVSFPAGFRIAGAGTRLYKQRTINLYLRRDYGQSSVKYPFFEGYDITAFKSLQLRHMGAWQDPTLLRDAYLSNIVNGMKINNAQTKFAAVYINGRYWGMYEFKEDENEKYLAAKYNVDKDEVVTVRANDHNVNTGKKDKDIQELYSLAAKDMNDPDNFSQYTKLADSAYFMDYLIAETFFECSDTYNQKFTHTTDNTLKWQPLYYDLDRSLTDIKTNNFTRVFFRKSYVRHNATDTGPAGITNMSLYYAFYRNDEWMIKFFKRYAYVLGNILTEEKLLAAFDEIRDSIKSEMQRTIERWGFPASMSRWNKEVSSLRSNIIKRRSIVIDQLYELRAQLIKEGRLKPSDINMAKLFPNG